MENDDNEKVLLTLRHSRKAFLVEYFCSLFLFFLLFLAFLQKVEVPDNILHLVLGLGVLGIVGTEVRRYFGDRYRIMPKKLSIMKGVLKVKKKNVYYQPLGFIPDLNIKQSAVQRLLGFGTVYLQVGSSNLELRDIDDPHQVLKLLENLIEEARRAQRLQTLRQ